MNFIWISSWALAGYFLASMVQALPVTICRQRFYQALFWAFALSAVSLHGWLLHEWIDLLGQQNLSVLNLASIALWLLAILLLIISLFQPVSVLVLLVFPLSALSIVLVQMFPNSAALINTLAHKTLLFHVILSVFTFAVFVGAGLFALTITVQVALLRTGHLHGFIDKLPPLQSMEQLLFQLIITGFILLSILNVSSFYCYASLLLTHPWLLQKMGLALLAWLIFAVLLWGRKYRGWREKSVLYYILAGELLLALVYFGSQFILGATH